MEGLRVGSGARRYEPGLVLSAELDANDIAAYLDDACHELARPGERIQRNDR